MLISKKMWILIYTIVYKKLGYIINEFILGGKTKVR